MLQQTTINFLKTLQKNNNKPWFDAHRPEYEKAKADFLQMVEQLIGNMAKFDKTLTPLQPKDCLFRINRDVRFSANKSPYKNNMAAYFNKDGKKGEGAGYYLHIEPGKSFLAAGIWQPLPANLVKIRQEIDYNLKDFEKLLKAASFKKQFPDGLSADNKLSRPPKGYADNNPAIEYIKNRSFIVMHHFADADILKPGFVKQVAAAFKNAEPLVRFVNVAVE
ncbi:MAG: DUF2461 domain-containing protein [Ferruginibacter sp.]